MNIWNGKQNKKSDIEYINGEVFAMVGGTIDHSMIAANLIALFRPHVKRKIVGY